MTDWSTRPQDMATVDRTAPPKSNAIFWGDITAISLFIGGVVMAAVWWLA